VRTENIEIYTRNFVGAFFIFKNVSSVAETEFSFVIVVLTVQKLQSKCPGRIFHRKTEEEK
jgi:hypothetical protein